MRTNKTKIRLMLMSVVIFISNTLLAQQPTINYYHENDKAGINKFETTKEDLVPFTGVKVRVGGAFNQNFQSLSHENVVDTSFFLDGNTDGVDDRSLYRLAPGFNLAEANLNLNVQLADGVRLELVTYLSTRHHNEAWVKGGYIQFDKLPFVANQDNFFNKFMTLKVGHMEINYGDSHFRRSDAGYTMQNPFIEGNIMESFTTEIAGELYYQNNGWLAMFGLTTGELKGNIFKENAIDPVSADTNKRSPAIIIKLGYDKQINESMRFRITGSMYSTASSAAGTTNTLYGGDRSGSDYYLVMENTAANATANAFSGRYNPGFKDAVTAFQFNPFFKYNGLEIFGTIEFASGRSLTEAIDPEDRSVSQYGGDVIYRFFDNENVYLGLRYMMVSSEQRGVNDQGEGIILDQNQDITRFAGVVGWFVTDNILAKLEYVTQSYTGFSSGTIFYDGWDDTDLSGDAGFNGIMLSGSIAF
ncbi:MAG: hypothetical protein IPG60_12705 [Bacteroidetes bacterium]|nr:hypothetical protein [Bacteroidota bacterium]MBP7398235.1 hypothetical protein [Chitinophagales bacterium]MBK7109804.1 hypothetical protein [Bacteroidota bacterium]MBK8487459.1 hypothetical protein [Bacteroidota bacterium]MBK8682798.1 hypothetical protein [Bacteroidota bacterium]